jgi:hypothetical protein
MIRITSLLFLALCATTVFAISDTQFESVRGVGKLNGVALNCGYIDETRRMKRALVATVPKLRVIGQAFDESTNEAFLQMIADKAPCPAERTLSSSVDQALQQLQQQFSNSTLFQQ